MHFYASFKTDSAISHKLSNYFAEINIVFAIAYQCYFRKKQSHQLVLQYMNFSIDTFQEIYIIFPKDTNMAHMPMYTLDVENRAPDLQVLAWHLVHTMLS